MNNPNAMRTSSQTVDVVDLCLTALQPATAYPCQISVIRGDLTSGEINLVLHTPLRIPVEPLPEATDFFRPESTRERTFIPSINDLYPYILESVDLHGNVAFPHSARLLAPATQHLCFPRRSYFCATRIARHLWPRAPSHQRLDILCYWLNEDP